MEIIPFYRSSRRFSMLLLLLFLVLPLGVSADELSEPQRVIQELSDQLKQMLGSNQEQLKSNPGYVYSLASDVLVPHIDFVRVSSLVLGKYWRRASSAEKEEFRYQFQRLLVRTYSTAFHQFDEWELRHQPIRMASGADDVSVHVKVLRPDAPPVTVIYRMHLNDGRWQAYDVKIEGISLVTNYRSSFSKQVRKKGLSHLIRRITNLNERRQNRMAAS